MDRERRDEERLLSILSNHHCTLTDAVCVYRAIWPSEYRHDKIIQAAWRLLDSQRAEYDDLWFNRADL